MCVNDKKVSRGLSLSKKMWNDLDEISSLIGYNPSQFAATCIDTIMEMIHNPEKRHLPLIVRMVDQAKATQEEVELFASSTKRKHPSKRKKKFKNLVNNDL